MKLVIGFITYGDLTAKYLPYFLPSIEKSAFKDYKILVIDNTEIEENENIKYLIKNYPDIEIISTGKNLGFARAYNKLIRRANELGAEYFLMLNPDMLVEPAAIKLLIFEMDNNKELAAVCPKILKWDFKNKRKTNIIDTCGIKLNPGLRFTDLGQSKIDKGQYDKGKIIGPSGAAGLYKLASLEKVKQGREYFDELMFMYKEDSDLAYRLFLFNFRVRLIGKAKMYHDRTASSVGQSTWQIIKSRKNKNRQIKKWSFLNQQIIFKKYWDKQNLKNKLIIIFWQFKMLIYILFFEQYLLGQYKKYFKIRKRIKRYGL